MNTDLLSTRLAAIKPSATVAITAKAAEMRASGKDVISLSAGEPDFDTPMHIRQKAIEAIENGQTRYTAPDGTAELKAAIARSLYSKFAIEYTAQNIIATTGGKIAIFEAMMATLNAGDEVVIIAPYWVSYPDIVKLMGGKPVIVEGRAENNFFPDVDDLQRAISKKTKWIITNSPSNPTGAVHSREQIAQIAGIMDAHPQLMLLSDDIYDQLVFEGSCPHLLDERPDLRDRCLIVNGVSKSYAMTGWRIGYAAGSAPLIGAMKKIQGQSTNNPCSISQAAASAAFQGDMGFLGEWMLSFKRRRDFVYERLSAMNGVAPIQPKGAFYHFFAVTEALENLGYQSDVELCEALLENAGVALVPGTAFGARGFVRLSFAESDAKLHDALDRMQDFFNAKK